ncbi:hypothetical protein FXO37_10622 [Capsicum annuum]|nr:hypothetical protein FXO37_10622 [Capsicum annuum]
MISTKTMNSILKLLKLHLAVMQTRTETVNQLYRQTHPDATPVWKPARDSSWIRLNESEMLTNIKKKVVSVIKMEKPMKGENRRLVVADESVIIVGISMRIKSRMLRSGGGRRDFTGMLTYIPPMFARSVSHLTDQETYVEDSSGRRWRGWPEFSAEHDLKVGNFLVFRYVPATQHFIVQVFGTSGSERINFCSDKGKSVARAYSDAITPLLQTTSGKAEFGKLSVHHIVRSGLFCCVVVEAVRA